MLAKGHDFARLNLVIVLNADGSPADIALPDLAAAIADDVEQKAHLFQRFTVAN